MSESAQVPEPAPVTAEPGGQSDEDILDGPTRFWSQVQRRIIVTSTMERDVRLAFASGSAIIALVMLIHLFKRNLGPPVVTIVGSVPLGALVLLGLGELTVFSLLFLGLFRISRWRRNIALAAAALILAASLLLNDTLENGMALFVPLAGATIIGEYGLRKTWKARLRLYAALGMAALTMVIFVTYLAIGAQAQIIDMLGLQGLIAMIGLFMSATDLAEMVSLAAEAGVSSLGMFKSNRLMVIEAALLAIASFAVGFLHSDVSPLVIVQTLASALGLVPWVGLLYWLLTGTGKKLGSLRPELRYRNLLLIVCLYFVGLEGGLLQRYIENPQTYDPHQMMYYTSAFEVPFFLFVAFLLIFLIKGRRSPEVFVWSGFAWCVGWTWFMYYGSHGDDLIGLQDAIALGSLIYIACTGIFRRLRPRLRAVCAITAQLNLCYIIYMLVVSLFFATRGEGGQFTFWQVCIVIAALVWDILSSGGSITNQHNEAFPRISRVSFFLAYAVSVALLVLVCSSGNLTNPATGAPAEGVFEPEAMVAAGLALFGPPFFILIFMLKFRVFGGARPLAPHGPGAGP